MNLSYGLELADPDELRWLRELDPEASLSFMPHVWPAETWVLHGMWEVPGADPSDVLAVERLPRGGLFATQITGFPSPPPGWPRLWWRDLGARLGEPLATTARTQPAPPCFRWFSLVRWPDWITQPCEGSLDQPTADRLLSVLTRFTSGGGDGSCFVHYSGAGWPFGEWAPLTFRGPLLLTTPES
ncbi:hypothetical protein [Actinomycetospora soli]|uniref:hypothetical protein n=1 Tax=Actinomycetospora soli TaxID=2893887 RepID=UPI001E53EAD4|nr:hypothetical protein [Actinomycetospora soli]MCD2191255.1 hypothetical protein [Actinomycetospora soli]